MRPNLVVLRCGRGSLHPRWLEGGSERTWDLLLCPYQPVEDSGDLPAHVRVIPGQKWIGLAQLLAEDPVWRGYEYIWLPDDDLMITSGDLSRFFALCRRFEARLAQPALSEDSCFSYAITMRNRAFFARRTEFVEIMAPCFRRDALELAMPTFAEDATGYGWGLNDVWPKLLNYEDIYIIDAITMRHARPVGAMRSRDDLQACRRSRVRLLRKYAVQRARRTLCGYRDDGQPIDAAWGRFLLDYLNGYDYLIEHRPERLWQLVVEQFPEQARRHRAARKTKVGKARRSVLGRWWRKLSRGLRGAASQPGTARLPSGRTRSDSGAAE